MIISRYGHSLAVDENSPDTLIDVRPLLTGVDIPGDDSFSYSISENNNPAFLGAKTVASAAYVRYRADAFGEGTFSIRATNGDGNFIEVPYSVTVNAISMRPRIRGLSAGPAAIYEGDDITLTADGVSCRMGTRFPMSTSIVTPMATVLSRVRTNFSGRPAKASKGNGGLTSRPILGTSGRKLTSAGCR